MSDLFAFEVPTSQGRFRVIGPTALPADELQRVAAKLNRVLLAIVLPLQVPDPAAPTEEERQHDPD